MAVFAVSNPAFADWPNAGHDPQRTSVAVATSDIEHPAVYWKAYVGGNLDPTGFLAGDVDNDGDSELVYVTGGSVVAKRAGGQLLWQTPPHDIQAIYAIDDFDGDGRPDILAAGTSQAFLLAGRDGTFEWSEDPTDFGTLGALRVADLNGDKRPDVVAEECHCCAITSGGTGFAYSFARAGNAVVATRLWSLPPMASGDFYSCGVPTVVFDGNGDGRVELAHAGQSHMWVFGSGGQILVDDSRSPAIGQSLFFSDCVPANVDGTPGDELVCFQEHVTASQPTPRSVFVLHYDAPRSSLDLLWQNTSLADAVGGDLDFQPDAVVDLDGNGTKEVVVSGMTSAGVWTTYIFDAKTGTALATIPNARTAGTAPLRSDGKIDVLTSSGQDLTAWVYDAASSPPLSKTWTQPDRRTVTRVDAARLRTLRANQALVTPDLDQDGTPDLLALTVSPGSVLYGYSAPAGAATQIAAFTFPVDVDPIGTWVIPPTTRRYPQIATAANDGLLRVFDNQLKPTEPIRVGGFCAGGLQRGPVLASLGGYDGTQSMFVSDSRGALLRFDAQTASLANPPRPQWSRRDCVNPSVIPGIDGARPGVVCRGAQQPVSYPPLPALSALRGDGSLIWNAPLPDKGAINDALPGSVDASGAPAVLVQTSDQEGRVTTRSLSGSTAAQSWASPAATIQWGVGLFSVSDWNGDGVLDVLSVLNSMQAISGASGTTLVDGGLFLGYGVPILKDIDNNGTLEATLQSGYYPARTFQHDLTTPTWMGTDTRPYPKGAIGDCPGAPQLVEGSWIFPSRIYFTPVAGAKAGQSTFTVLAGGKQYPDEASAKANGAYLGQLSDLSIGTNITGSHTPTAVLGSSDGWLYAVDACSGKLQFSLELDASVCGAVFGDTDADGRDEILASTSGGYVYDIQNQEVGGCGHVLDTDPPNGIFDRNVDQIVTKSTLFGAWQAAPDAASYEVAVVHDPEGIISDPAWQDVGNVTAASVTGLPLVPGETYYFAVRAVNAQGRSPDSLSDGVTVLAAASPNPLPPGGGPTSGPQGPSASAGCGCRTSGSGSSGGAGLAIVLGAALATWYGRRRRGSRIAAE